MHAGEAGQMPTDITKLPLREVMFSGRTWKTGQPIRFGYRETRLWPDTEFDPSGEWLVVARADEEHDGWLRFRRPLVLNWGAPRGPKSWVWKLWKLFRQRKGPEITRILHRMRYDGIITVRWDRPYQILNLTGQDAPWFLQTPGVSRVMDQCRAIYTKEFANLSRQYRHTRELLDSPELSELFSQHLAVQELQGAHKALWGAWEASTRSDPALHLCGLLSHLGVSGRPLEGDSEEQRSVGAKDKELLEVIEHQYAFLQVLLEQSQRKTAKVYRGIRGHSIRSRWLTPFTREASSWSLSLRTALKEEVALGAVVPVERLLLVPGTRVPKHSHFSEVVVLGATDLVNVRWEHPNARQTGRQMLDLSRRDEDWIARRRQEKSVRRITSAHWIVKQRLGGTGQDFTAPWLQKAIRAVEKIESWNTKVLSTLKRTLRDTQDGFEKPYPIPELVAYLVEMHHLSEEGAEALYAIAAPRKRKPRKGVPLSDAYAAFSTAVGKSVAIRNLDFETDSHLSPWVFAWGKAFAGIKSPVAKRIWNQEVQKVLLAKRGDIKGQSRETASWDAIRATLVLTLDEKAKPSVPSLRSTLIHEMGHALEEKAGGLRAIWTEGPFGKAPYVSNYAELNASEDFAESFRTFIQKPSQLRRTAPEKHDFIASLV